MQLFITEYKKNNTSIVISDTELLSQLRKVLRASIGDIIWIQSPENESKKIRYEVRIEVWDNKTVEGTIISGHTHDISASKKNMIIAMPNKWDKIEMIVQKLTECSLDKIIFWPSERSVIKEWNPKKEERIHKIMKEAVEQSRGWKIPELIFTTIPIEIIGKNSLIVFDKTPHSTGNDENIGLLDSSPHTKSGLGSGGQKHIYGLIGPEGGLTKRDYQLFAGTEYTLYGLGETILRTETAAIIGGWLVKNNFD